MDRFLGKSNLKTEDPYEILVHEKIYITKQSSAYPKIPTKTWSQETDYNHILTSQKSPLYLPPALPSLLFSTSASNK